MVAAIPPSRVCTYQAIGEHLDAMPRHVAYILSQLPDAEKRVYPWHRVVSADGSLGAPKQGPDGKSQAQLMESEGVQVRQNSVAPSLPKAFVSVAELPGGAAKQSRSVPVIRSKAGPTHRSAKP
jgi:methylated-DNA-protein-cysteine methyltransferase-like protein